MIVGMDIEDKSEFEEERIQFRVAIKLMLVR
jgi:hypothetical protein